MLNKDLVHAQQVRTAIYQTMEHPASQKMSTRDMSMIVVILASSRGGSSLLFELLRQSQQMLAIDGEHVPFYKLARCCFPFNNIESDAIPAVSDSQVEQLGRDILSSITMGGETDTVDRNTYFNRLALRLALQWPQYRFTREQLLQYFHEAYLPFAHDPGTWNTNSFLLELIRVLQDHHFDINPYYYDLPGNVIREYFPRVPMVKSPPHADFCIEEPPFVVVRPRRLPTDDDLRTKPLLMKASVDAYRLPVLKQLFPNATLKVIHLTRNPAASINGLFDGWHDRGFYSYNVGRKAKLAIEGYSDRYAWGQDWWNFDLPPGWQAVTRQPLEYVCGFQWYSAHRHILEHLKGIPSEQVLRINFEALLCSSQRRAVLQRIAHFIGIQIDRNLESVVNAMPVVMATTSPQARRWLQRKDIIWPVVHQPEIAALATELGYTHDREEEWL